MKFFGGGSLAFNQLEKYYEKERKKKLKTEVKQTGKVDKDIQVRCKNLAEQLIFEYYNSKKQKSNEKIKQRLEIKGIFSAWEQKVYRKFDTQKIKFDKKFRRFPLKISEHVSIIYEPDFLLEEYEIDGKEIIIEAHEELTSDDVVKYTSFMKKYFPVFFLVMIVKDGELRLWNEFNESNKMFNDIWTMDGLEYLIQWIHKQNLKKQEYGHVECPQCHITVVGSKQIESFFGFRKKSNGEKFPQSLCRDCRSIHLKLGAEGLKQAIKKSKEGLATEVKRFCSGCNNYFITKISGESFCAKCNEKYWKN